MKMRNWCAVAALSGLCAASGALMGASPEHAADAHASAHAAPAPAAHVADKSAPAAAAHSSAAPEVSPNNALKNLIEGNERYLSSLVEHPHSNAERRCDTYTNGQHPIASILSCADSRAPVELLFDQGIGDLFVIRVAGNVADTDEIGTIEYGAGHLHTPLIVVLGHTKCGAVTAVVNEAKVSENIGKLVDNVVPAVATAKKNLPGAKGETLIQAAIDANVHQSIADLLSRSEEVRHLVSEGKVKVVGAVYDIHIGSVRWLGEHPRQSELVKGSISTASSAKPAELLHGTTAVDKHAEPAHGKPVAKDPRPAPAKGAHATPTNPHDAGHGAAEKTAKEHDDHAATSDAAHPPMPHEAGTIKGMLIPGAFLGGAGLVSGAIFHFMKGKKTAAPAPAVAEPPAAPAQA